MIDFACIRMVWERDVIRYFREKSQLYGSLSRPILWLFVLGLGLRGSASGIGNVNYTQFIFPGIIAMTAIFTSIQSAISIIWDREFGFLKEILVAPVPRTSIVIGKGLAGTTLSLVQGCIIILLAPLVHVHIPLVNIVPLIFTLAVMSFGLTGIGIVIAARMTSFQGFGTIMNFIIMPMWFLSGALFPARNLPIWLNALVRVNPLTYGVDLVRKLVLGFSYHSPVFDFVFLVCFGALTVGAAVFFFNIGEY
ncbi:MAG TPA: ABC transporter permease [bacterium]|nr:ABC transporter permease [bacterium]